MKLVYRLHLHMKSGRVASLRPCTDYTIRTHTDRPGLVNITLDGHAYPRVGERYVLLETIDISEVQYAEVEVVAQEEEEDALDVGQ